MDKTQNQNTVKNVTLSSIDVAPNYNARQDFGDLNELAEQIRENGLLEPITVIPYTNRSGEERHLLVNGERRVRAIRILDEQGETVDIPAHFVNVDIAIAGDTPTKEEFEAVMSDMYVQQYVRNASKPFTDYETALLFKRLRDSGKKNGEIAKALGKNPGVVTYYLDIFNWDQKVQDMVAAGEIGIMNATRVLKANKAKYGADYEKHFTAEMTRIHEKAVAKADTEGEEKVKATLKDADLFGYVKESKVFVAGIRVLKQYLSDYTKSYPGLRIQINPIAFFERLANDDSLTLKDLFDEAVKKAKETVA